MIKSQLLKVGMTAISPKRTLRNFAFRGLTWQYDGMITPENLPNPKELKLRIKSLAALDAIYSPEWEYRYYSFDSRWDKNEEMGSIRNGSGDDVYLLFNSNGCFIKGFSHEFQNSGLNSENFYADVPLAFAGASKEPAFTPNKVSFCSWNEGASKKWESSIPDTQLDSKSFFLIQDLAGDAESYQNFVSDYYESEAELGNIKAVFNHQPLTQKLAEAINSEIDYSSLIADLNEIDYPFVV